MHSIDVAWLHRRGMLEVGRYSSVTWSMGGERTGSIRVIEEADGARLHYTVTGQDGAKINIDELVPFAYTATRFGGRRR